jgi:hypothetical protein
MDRAVLFNRTVGSPAYPSDETELRGQAGLARRRSEVVDEARRVGRHEAAGAAPAVSADGSDVGPVGEMARGRISSADRTSLG